MSESDPSQSSDPSATQFTRDFIGLCIGILSVALVILILAVCKWSRCLSLKRNYNQTEDLTAVVQSSTTIPRPYRQSHPSQNQRLSSCDRPRNVHPSISTTRNGLLSSPQPLHNAYHPHDVKVSRVKITTLSVQTSQQLVPRLSLSPQVSSSSITRSTSSIKQ